MEFKLNLSLQELRKRTNKEYLRNISFLTAKDEEYVNLSKNDKQILALLDKAGQVFDTVSLKQDNKYNLEFLDYLNREIKKGNEKAKLTKILFTAQKGMFSPDYEGNQIALAKDIDNPIGLNFYPDDLEIKQFHNIIEEKIGIVKSFYAVLPTFCLLYQGFSPGRSCHQR